MEPRSDEESRELWEQVVESMSASPDQIDDSQIVDTKTASEPVNQEPWITAEQADALGIKTELNTFDVPTFPWPGADFAELYGGSRQSVSETESRQLYERLANMYLGMRHSGVYNSRESEMFDGKMMQRMHWFAACQIAKYRIKCTKADKYFDAGYISKRHAERMVAGGRQDERFESHFRGLIRGLYMNHEPNVLYQALRMAHWTLPRVNCPIPIDEYYGIIYSSLWHSDYPIVMHKAWRTETVKVLAEGIWLQKAWDRMPILADALEDAGCDDTRILHRLRTEELTFPATTIRGKYSSITKSKISVRPPHHRGCYILHRILGGRFHSRRNS